MIPKTVKTHWDLSGIPNPSPESEKLLEEAKEVFARLRDTTKFPYLVLIGSTHWASEGYWIEDKETTLGYWDSIILKHTSETVQ